MGVVLSTTSDGTVRTPDGKATVDRPSSVGRAPVPPVLNRMESKSRVTRPDAADSGSTAERPPRIIGFHIVPAPSAGTRSGITWARQPKIRSGSIWPTVWRADTGSGRCTLRMDPTGALTVTAESDPALQGTSGATMQLMPKAL